MNQTSPIRSTALALGLCAATALGACSRSHNNQPAPPATPSPTTNANTGLNTALAVVGGLQRLAQATATPADGSTNATSRRGQLGQRFTYNCPAGFALGTAWGQGVYSDDSSICTAGVHAGAITQASGGLVTIEIRAGQPAYPGAVANGVTTQTFGQFPGSFAVITGAAPSGAASPWAANASSHRAAIGQRFTYVCPPGGQLGSAWGSGSYTDDSSVCTAAVHAGRINPAMGGAVTIEMRPGQPSYMGSPANGVTTSNYAQYPGSFVFP